MADRAERREGHSEGLIDHAFRAMTQGVDTDWPDVLVRLAASSPGGGSAPVKTVAQLQHLLKAPRFHAIPASWNLLRFVFSHWDWVAVPFRQTIASATVHAFERSQGYLGPFIAAEILGEKCADRWALEKLNALARTAALPGRSLVAHGLQWLVRSTRDAALRESALGTLRELAASEIPEVSLEATEALRRFKRCGGLS